MSPRRDRSAPCLQRDILAGELALLRESLDGDMQPGYNAAVMLEWHACYYEEAFEPLAQDCERLLRDARDRDNWSTKGYLLVAPIELALAVRQDRFESVPIPYSIEANLWHESTSIRRWMREVVYWAAPMVKADSLWTAFLCAADRRQDIDELAFLIALCDGGFETLWDLREIAGADELDGAIALAATDAQQHNRFADRALAVTTYMFVQSQLYDDWLRGELGAKLFPPGEPFDTASERSAVTKLALDNRYEALAKDWVRPGDVAKGNRWLRKKEPLRSPLYLTDAWYRLAEYADGALTVERRRDEGSWYETREISTAEFIRELLKAKGVYA